ncbi:hypothetical protein Tco_1295395 [Tanacetum coccineum]
MVEEPVKTMKMKDLIRLDEEIAKRLQAEFNEEERLAREKDEANNMEGKKLKDLKNKSFDSIQKMFDRAFKRQKVNEDKDTTELQSLMEVIPDEEEVAIDAIPLAVKSPNIVDWKIHKEGKNNYFQIIRVMTKFKDVRILFKCLKSFGHRRFGRFIKLVRLNMGQQTWEDMVYLLWNAIENNV